LILLNSYLVLVTHMYPGCLLHVHIVHIYYICRVLHVCIYLTIGFFKRILFLYVVILLNFCIFVCNIFFSLSSVASTLKRCLCAFENLSDEPLVYDFELDSSFLLFGRRNDSFCCCIIFVYFPKWILLVPLQHIFMVHCST
jgi:hypothetical protein